MPSARRSPLLLAALALLLGLAGCSLGSDDEPAGGDRPERARSDVVRVLTRSLHARAAAVRHADLAAFTGGLGGRRDFRADQRTWFGNVTQLPLQRFDYRLDRGSLVRDGDAYWVVVRVRIQLEGYDEAPVVTPDRFRFEPGRRHPRRLLLTSVTDPGWETQHDVRLQPWDLGPVVVREGAGVLGVFDAASVGRAGRLLASFEDGIAAVAAEVPYDWSRTVVVYALSDPTYLDSLEDVPGNDPEALDAVAVPVRAGPRRGRIVATRVVLNPGMLGRTGRERDRLVRHELTHVAVGARDDRVPVWLSEGLAEYVSVRPVAPQDRRIPDAAVAAARQGVDDLPVDDTFNDDDSQAHYGLAWWAVEYIADSWGPDAPWQLLDAMGEQGAVPAQVLRDRLGTDSHELARHADRLILAIYEPDH